MPARFIPIGEPSHDPERQALRFLVEGLPDDYTVYGNPWLVDRNGAVFELDAVVVAPHAFYVVEIKSYRGTIVGNDNDWYVPQPIRSPLKLNRKTAQILSSLLKSRSVDAARPYVEGFVFLSHAEGARVVGPASADRVHLRRTVLSALRDPSAIWRREGRRPDVDTHSAATLDQLLLGSPPSHRPVRLIREWKIEAPLDQADRWAEYFATHRITGQKAVLRVYSAKMLDDEAIQKRVEELFRWEAQVLRRIGEHPNIVHAQAPFVDEAGYVLPFEPFSGVTLGTWIERHGARLHGAPGLRAKIDLWKTVALAIDAAHRQGVVHRLLRPEVVVVEDTHEKPGLRVVGFELAKQLDLPGQTIAVSTLADDRRRFSAPEVVRSFSDADARSDQFSLGALLAQLLAGRPVFDSTEEMIRRGGVFTRPSEANTSLKKSLDGPIATMLALASANRFPSIEKAIEAVELAAFGKASLDLPFSIDPENIAEGTQLRGEYEVRHKLGAGGMATVYLARHLVSGTSRALKVARPDTRAEEALLAEHQALQGIDHPNIVRAIDISNVVPDRKTLILERARGTTLAARLAGSSLTDEERRLYAEHLLAALGYLEQKGIVHKDIKPDNLIVSDDGLTLIDFSLAGHPPEDTLVGTALYRDPAVERWSPVADRYAASLCLFEIYVGRHAFHGRAPSPRETPAVDAQDFDRPAMAAFFRKALSPYPQERPPSAIALRSALHEALGSRASPSVPPGAPSTGRTAGDAPLSVTSLSGTALAALRRASIVTQGALVALAEAKIAALPGLGTKKRDEILALRRALVEAGVTPPRGAEAERHPLFPALVGHETDVHALGLSPGLAESLDRAGLATVGRLADATRLDLLQMSGIGPKTIAQIVQALQRFAEPAHVEVPATLDALWDLASRPLQGQQATIVERLYGLRGQARTQVELSDELALSQPSISFHKQRALDLVDRRVLDETVEHLESLLVSAGGLLRIDDAAARLTERWPCVADLSPVGFVRLLADMARGRFTCLPVLDEEPHEVLARPVFDAKSIEAFLGAARTYAAWPPKKAEGTRASLQAHLPEYPLDPLGLATRLSRDLRLTDDGELYEAPVPLREATLHVLRKARPPIHRDAVREALLAHFGTALAEAPDLPVLAALVAGLPGFQLDSATGMVDVAATRSIDAKSTLAADPPPAELRVFDPAEQVCRTLAGQAERDGFRLVVAAPEQYPAIARSLPRCLGPEATFVSFEDAFFRRIEPQIDAFERAERFTAQKPRLRREAEAVLDALVAQQGRARRRLVLGDTALWGVCDALHLVRRLYDLTATGGKGHWVLVIPGLVHQRQPIFNEKPGATVFSIEGAVWPLSAPVRAAISP